MQRKKNATVRRPWQDFFPRSMIVHPLVNLYLRCLVLEQMILEWFGAISRVSQLAVNVFVRQMHQRMEPVALKITTDTMFTDI